MEIFDKAAWQIDGGIPEEVVVNHFRNVFTWLFQHGMLSEDGEEEFEDGIDDCASLNTDLLTDEATIFLSKHYDEFLTVISKEKYGIVEEIDVLEDIYQHYLLSSKSM